jgi:hypothetical protein
MPVLRFGIEYCYVRFKLSTSDVHSCPCMMQSFGAISTWTIYLANSLYVEAKRRKVNPQMHLSWCVPVYIGAPAQHFLLLPLQLAAGEWYAPGTKSRKQATQYFEVVGYLTNRCVHACSTCYAAVAVAARL